MKMMKPLRDGLGQALNDGSAPQTRVLISPEVQTGVSVDLARHGYRGR